ncbi:MAG TPA: DUF2461 domain-containing protein [Bacteroidales bacterium]|jgi:uncharacterized protein (TIGR02453 family)|nr:DUF2461 domain-containing protein [Bacteroidales bacterium]
MNTIDRSTLKFLADLRRHNYRLWFAENRSRYEAAREDLYLFVQAVIDEIVKFDPIFKGLEAKNCIYRINRDIRFTNDKTIYKTNFGAFMVRGGKKNGDRFPGYYLHIEPGQSFISGGSYMPPAPWLKAIRERIAIEGDNLVKILNNREFRKYFNGLEGEKLKLPPRGFSKDHPHIELIKMKSFLTEKPLTDSEVVDPGFFEVVTGAFRAMKPLNDFLTTGR